MSQLELNHDTLFLIFVNCIQVQLHSNTDVDMQYG